jgi:hypothetical protein
MTQIPSGFKVFWKPYPAVNLKGGHYMAEGPVPGNKFLLEIEQMPPGKPLTFQEAMNLMHAAYARAVFGSSFGLVSDTEKGLYIRYNFVEWLQSQGYQVILTGDEWCLVEDVLEPLAPPVEKGPAIQLQIKVGGHATSLITHRERPPIQRILATGPKQIEIQYETGEREGAHLMEADKPYYLVDALVAETLGGKPSSIKPYKWVA